MSGSGFRTTFDDTLAALDHEFAFLIDDYGFLKSEPGKDGRERSISYYQPSYVELLITQEPLSGPFLLLYVKPGVLTEHWKFTPLRLIGRRRNPDWVEPVLESASPSEAELRAYLRSYADLLKESFEDVLTIGQR